MRNQHLPNNGRSPHKYFSTDEKGEFGKFHTVISVENILS